MKIRAEVVITGRVQQVGFRRHTLEKARQLEVTGWVRNLDDGSVAGCFEGQRGDVESLVAWSRTGPERASVATVSVEWAPCRQEFGEFSILTGETAAGPPRQREDAPDLTGVREIEVRSTLDGVVEPSLLFVPEGDGPFPLLVALHTWSYDRFNQLADLLPLCRERGWALLLPEFRGPNLVTNPRARQAGGSRRARQDVIDAVRWVSSSFPVDPGQTFLLGGSGGGHLALLVAADEPSLWTAVSAWVPITDLAAWHAEQPEYAPHVAACCGGVPGSSAEVDRRYRERSPLHVAERLAGLTLSLHHGRFDTTVPARHSWRLAELLEALGAPRFFFEIFDGGHEIRFEQALRWFEVQGERAPDSVRLTG